MLRLGRWALNLASEMRRARDGSTALIFALLVPAIALSAFGAVDIAGLYSAKARAQDSLDAAILSAANSGGTTEASLLASAQSALTINTTGTSAAGASITKLTYDSSSQTITATASGAYAPTLAFVFSNGPLIYTVTDQVTRQLSGSLEVALVLDNTWSMSQTLGSGQTKIDALKQAAKLLIAQFMTVTNQGKVKIGVVPYADYVNVGVSNAGASWLNVANAYTTTVAPSCRTVSTQESCSGGTQGTCSSTKDGVTTYQTCTVGQTCTTLNVTSYQSCSSGDSTTYKWWGCVPNKVSNGTLALPDTMGAYTGILSKSQRCLSPITPMTNDVATVNIAIDNLIINVGGYYPETYIPSEMVWGVNVLSPAAPFTEGAAYDPKNASPRKVMVLMTDGANTESLNNDGTLSTGSPTATYTAEASICAYAKQNNIEIYTIGVGVTDQTALQQLQNCATDSAHYFDAQSTSAMIAAFAKIAQSLSQIRLAA